MPAALPRIEALCTHRGAARREHLQSLAALCARAGPASDAGSLDRGPLVLVHCGERGARRVATGALLGCEVVHVRLGDPALLEQATDLVRGAVRFAEQVGDLRGPRRGPLARLGSAPVDVSGSCPGAARCGVCMDACPARALRPGEDGRPKARAGACTFCGECVGRCPLGAMSFSHAPWRALDARLRALLANADARPVAVVLRERSEPPLPDDPTETDQPLVPWLLPLELPRGTLCAGVVLRALELGAAAVYAIVPCDDAPCAARMDAVIAFARAIGSGGRVARACSLDEVVARVRQAPPPLPRLEPVARDPARRPDAMAIALSLWRGASGTPLRLTGPGAFGGAAAVDEDACTLCGLCVAACPTGALAQRRSRTVALELDSSRCPDRCGRCESACPERALTISPEVRLPPEHATLVERAGSCAACGEPWPGAASVAALRSRLGGEERPALLAFLATCPGCRSRALGASLLGAQ